MAKSSLLARSMLIILATLLVVPAFASAANSIRVVCPAVMNPIVVGDSIPVEVHMTNDQQLGAYSLGFKYNSADVEILSVKQAAAGAVYPAAGFGSFLVQPKLTDKQVLVGWINFTPLAPIPAQTDGLLFTMYVRVKAGALKQCINIDSSFVPPAGQWLLSPQTGGSIIPDYSDCGTGDIILGQSSCVVANVPPVALCKNIQVFAGASCNAAASIDDGSNDPDNGPNPLTFKQVPAGPYPLGNTNVTLWVFDGKDSVSCSSIVTVIDNTNPVIACPSNIVKSNDPDQCGAIVTFNVGATDNCSGVTVVTDQTSGTLFPIGVTTVHATATDGSGNHANCQFTITVNDTQKPTITCPATITANNAAGQCGANVNFNVTANDNCPGLSVVATPASGSFFNTGTNNVKVVATDAAGNKDSCSFQVIVNDTELPAIACPADVVVNNDANQCGAMVSFAADATDNCPGVAVTYDHNPGTLFPIGTTLVTATATDGANNQKTCTFNVTVNDNQAPSITCPTDIFVALPVDVDTQTVNFVVNSTDNCPGVTVVSTPPSGSVFAVGETVVSSEATDAHGNKSGCTFKVTLQHGAVPDFSIAADKDSIFAENGIATPLSFNVTGTAINGFADMVQLSVVGLPTGASGNFAPNPFAVPGSSAFSGTTGTNTPAGVYPLTVSGAVPPSRVASHSDIVYLVVNPCTETPIVHVSNTLFNFTITEGDFLSPETVFVTNTAACGTLNWQAAADQSWLSPNPASGSVVAGDPTGSTLGLYFTTTLLASGSYTGHVTVSPVARGSVGATVTVNLTVNPKPVSADSVIVNSGGSTVVHSGNPIGVPVDFKNDEGLAGMSAGLHWNSADLVLDSVSYVGSRVAYVATKFNTINNINRTLALGILRIPPEPVVASGRGLWATLWFSAALNAECQTVSIDSQFISPGVEVLFNDEAANSIYPSFLSGSVNIDCTTPSISGKVVDQSNAGVPFANVELYDNFPPIGNPIATTVAGPDGSFSFDVFASAKLHGTKTNLTSYSVRAYKAGFYSSVREAAIGENNIILTLLPTAGSVTPTNEWVDLYCGGDATLDGQALPLGTVIEAFDPQGNLCGQWTVSVVGTFGFMPVYRDDQFTPNVDEGCEPGDAITLKVNGFSVTPDNGVIHWTGNGDRFAACFEATSTQEKCLHLKQGWNLVSWDIDTPDDAIETIIAGIADKIDVVLSFEQGGLTYDPALPDFSTLHTADHLHGFWFRMKQDADLCVKGSQVPASTPINLETNWNLVSYLAKTALDVPTALSSIDGDFLVVLGYDNGGLTYDAAHPELATLTQMGPGFGYWIKTDADVILMYPDGPVAVFSHPRADATSNKSSYVPKVALSNTWINLYGNNVKLNGAPLKAGSTIDAYDESGALIGETVLRNDGRFGFMPVYGAENLTRNAEGKSAGSKISLKVDGKLLDQTISWTSNGDRIALGELTTVEKSSSNLPNTFALNQNFPNPFNPETTINYTLAKSGKVELVIYNVLGNKIKTLVNEYANAGSYSIRWQGDTDNGAKVSSGVYFYKLSAGDFSDIKKMTLLK